MASFQKQAGFFILFSTLCSLFPAALQGDEQKAFFTFSGSLVTGELREAPLKLLLNELRKKKGLQIRGEQKVKKAIVSASFHETPLTAVIARILSRFNYSVIYDRHNRLIGIFIAGKVGHAGSRPSLSRSIRRYSPRRR